MSRDIDETDSDLPETGNRELQREASWAELMKPTPRELAARQERLRVLRAATTLGERIEARRIVNVLAGKSDSYLDALTTESFIAEPRGDGALH